MNITKFALLSILALGLAACDSSSQVGSLSVSVTDAPVDGATAVVVEFTGIELQGPGGRTDIDFDAPKTIDLLALQGTQSELLMSETDLPAGLYQWMRLKVNALPNTIDSYIEFENGMEQFSLYIPSGDETGLKLNRPFAIAGGGQTDFTIDFDLRQSVHLPSSPDADYKLRPSLRIVDSLEANSLAGTVTADVLTNNNCTADNAAIYVFEGADVVADDIDGADAEPITTANVDVSTGAYEVGFLLADHDYTLALTCTADLDDPEVDNADVVFIDQQNVSVTTDPTPPVDF